MRSIYIIGLTIASNLVFFIQGFSQLTNLASLGNLTTSFNKIYNVAYFENYKYQFYKDPIRYDKLKDRIFKKEHLKDPISVIRSFTVATSDEWFRQLFVGDRAASLSKERKEYVLSKEFEANYKFQVLSQYEFNYQNKSYQCVLVNFLNVEGDIVNFVFVVEKTIEGWKITMDADLFQFSSYFYLKPEVLYQIFSGQLYSADSEVKKYCYDGIFDTYANFYVKYMKSEVNSALRKIVIPINKIYSVKQNISISSENGVKVGVSKRSEISSIELYQYDQYDSWCFSREVCLEEKYFKYDSLPELAFASWHFSNSIKDKRLNSLEFGKIEKQAQLYLEQGIDRGRIEWQYKLVFYGASKPKYVLIYYSDWMGKSSGPSSGVTEKWIGEKSVLLEYSNGKWIVNLAPKNEIEILVRTFDLLSINGITQVLQSELTGDRIMDFYLRGNYLLFPPDGRIYVNKIQIYQPEFRETFKLPTNLQRKWPVLGPFDRYRVDDTLDYWLDRK